MKTNNFNKTFQIVRIDYTKLILILLLFFISKPSFSADKEMYRSSSLVEIDFRDAPLRDVIYFLTEKTGRGFAFSDTIKERISWSWRGRSLDIIPAFEKIIQGSGYGLIQDSPAFYIIRKIGQGSVDIKRQGYWVMPLIWTDSEAIEATIRAIFGESIIVSRVGEKIMVVGEATLVKRIGGLVKIIDRPIKGDFEVINVLHISLKRALEAFKNTSGKEGDDEKKGLNVYLDYWNRSLVVRGSAADRLVARGIVALIDKQQAKSERILWLHNLEMEKAENIVNDLGEGVYGKPFSKTGLLLSGPSDEVQRIASIIERIDGHHIQIRVQATIAQLSDSAFKELGISLKAQSKYMNGSLNGGNYDLLSVPGSGFLLDFIRGDFSSVLKASVNESNGEILSSPILTVLNGQTGKILVGQNVPFLGEVQETDGGRETRAVHRENVGVSLEITATEEKEGIILLQIKQEVSSVSPETVGAVDLITVTKEINTTVLVASGETIFLGGLRSELEGSRVERIPILGWIPILGQIFTIKTSSNETRHLVVSLRPEIVKSGWVQ